MWIIHLTFFNQDIIKEHTVDPFRLIHSPDVLIARFSCDNMAVAGQVFFAFPRVEPVPTQ